jgi:hypothetical protein
LLVLNQCADSYCASSGSVGVLLGNGNGTFQSVVNYGPGGYGALAVADFNGDGKLDVAYGDALLLGNGDGTFAPALLLGASTQGIAVGDFNQDGRPDLVVGGITVLLNISPFSSATTLSSSPNPSALGQSVMFSATVTHRGTGTPSGSVTFYDGTIAVGRQPLNGSSAQYSTSALTVGSHSITAAYSGDSNFRGSTSSPLNQIVNRASTTVSLGSSVIDQAVTFTGTISPRYGGSATGTVTFYDGTTKIGSGQVTNNAATLSISSLSIGDHSITASYSGDSNFEGSTSTPLMQIVTKAMTTIRLLSSINPSVSGKTITFKASVSSPAGTPTGKVQFLNGTTVLAKVMLASGSAKYSTSKLPSPSNSITVVYEGDSNNNGSTSAPLIQFVIAATTTTLTSSPNPSAYGEVVLFTAVAFSIRARHYMECPFIQSPTSDSTLLNGMTSVLASSLKLSLPG